MPTPLVTTPGRTVSLYDRPGIQQFTGRDAAELSRRLKELDNTTTTFPINSETEFQLDRDAKTKMGGYRFTHFAFSQVSQLLAPGLSKFLPDLAGSITLPEDREYLVDAGLSIDLWNRLVDLRFALFQHYRVIRNDKDKRIEGLVGNKHQYLENLALYEAANETLATHRPEVSFYAAMIVGRKLALWYRANTPMFVLAVDEAQWPFYYGYYFTNGEATGTSVRGTLAVFSCAGLCLSSYETFGDRVTHTGKEFYQRLGQMLSTVSTKEIPENELRSGAQALLTASLGFTPTMTKPERRQQQRRLVHSLSHIGVPQNLANEVVESGLTKGRGIGKANFVQLQDVSRVYTRRTLIDLFVPLMHVARNVDLTRREKIEQAAYEVLMGHILIPRSKQQ